MLTEETNGGGEARKNMISTNIGKVLVFYSGRGLRKKILMTPWTADDMEQTYELQEWLLVFEIALVTHLYVDQAVDDTVMLQGQEMQLEN